MARQDQDDGETNLVDVINVSGETLRFELDGNKYKMAPKDVIKINKAYANPRQLQEGKDPIPSVVELLTNKKVLSVTDKRVRSLLGNATPTQTPAPASGTQR